MYARMSRDLVLTPWATKGSSLIRPQSVTYSTGITRVTRSALNLRFCFFESYCMLRLHVNTIHKLLGRIYTISIDRA